MKSKLINKNAYEAVCKNCKYGRLSPEKDTVLCVKKGIVDPDGVCKKYSYDPLKRIPRKMPAVMTANPEDFDLNIGFEPPESKENKKESEEENPFREETEYNADFDSNETEEETDTECFDDYKEESEEINDTDDEEFIPAEKPTGDKDDSGKLWTTMQLIDIDDSDSL